MSYRTCHQCGKQEYSSKIDRFGRCRECRKKAPPPKKEKKWAQETYEELDLQDYDY